jgi:hypothetical protein
LKFRVFDVIGVAAILLFAGWIAHLGLGDDLLGGVERMELTDADRAAGWRQGTQWQGIYLKEQKVGYLRTDSWKEDGLYHLKSRMLLHLTVMKSRRKIETRVLARMDQDFALVDVEMQILSGPADLWIRGKVRDGKTVDVEFESAGEVQRETVVLKEVPRLNFSLKPMLVRKDLKVGDKISTSFFDPVSLAEREVVIEYMGRSTDTILGAEVQSHHFRQSFAGVLMSFWVNDIGEVLREELPMGLVGVRESSVEARYGVTTGTVQPAEDVIDSVSVRPEGAAWPPGAHRVSLRLSGLDFEGLDMDGGRQRWKPDPAGTSGTLVVELENRRGLMKHRVADAVRDQYTAEEPLIQTRSALIQRHAEKIAAGEEGVVSAAEKISAWAYEAIEKESVIGVPSAVETLRTRRGDCNEHATLVVALLRSLGIPARPAVGVVYLRDRHRFFYHAWVEVRAGNDWLAIDPTLGQSDQADLGHIRFVTGGLAEQVEMFRVIGQLEIEVLDE